MDKKRYNYKILCSYDGTNYCGWQIQPNGITIQELIQTAIRTVIKEEACLIGSGRTDAGVHAKGQVAHFHTDNEVDTYRLIFALNGMLPKDIRIKSLVQVPQEFHSQYSATGKIYHYHLGLGPIVEPTNRFWVTHVKGKFDSEKLIYASKFFIGKQDFTSFANSPSEGSAAKDPVRTLQRLDIVQEESGLRLEFEADGFLYKMVRNITGTLLDVASDKLDADKIPYIFECKDRKASGRSAPATGLFLMHVHYP